MNKMIASLMTAALLALFPAGYAESSEVVIGGMAPTTGNVATFGVGQRNAYELAVEELNAAGGLTVGGTKSEVRLVFEDEQNSPEVGATVARKL